MQKQLNSELFGETAVPSRVVSKTPLIGSQVGLEAKILETRQQVAQLSQALESVVGQVNEFIRGSQVKFDRLNQGLQRLEQLHGAQVQDSATQLSNLSARLTERKGAEVKVQEMIDRHNTILRGYEVRLSQLQKLMMEKEAQTLQAQAALTDAKIEIAKLKRL